VLFHVYSITRHLMHISLHSIQPMYMLTPLHPTHVHAHSTPFNPCACSLHSIQPMCMLTPLHSTHVHAHSTPFNPCTCSLHSIQPIHKDTQICFLNLPSPLPLRLCLDAFPNITVCASLCVHSISLDFMQEISIMINESGFRKL
jgi:hypothetical protein